VPGGVSILELAFEGAAMTEDRMMVISLFANIMRRRQVRVSLEDSKVGKPNRLGL